MRDAETANRISSSKYDEMRARRIRAARDKAASDREIKNEKLPEIKLFRNNSGINYQQQATGGSANDRKTVLEHNIENRELEWVEMPDGSLILK